MEFERVSIILDSRETQLRDELVNNKVEFSTEQLPVGDILFIKGKEKILLCERKTAGDLYSSILSRRYSEQRERLKSSGIMTLYILEGYKPTCFPNSTFRNEISVIGGALENLVLYHGISILPTLSVAHTAKVVANIAGKLQKKSPGDGDSENPIIAIFSQRKEKIMERIHEHQLLLIPGVSPHIARTIASKFPTVRSLIAAYDNAPDRSSAENLLAEIQLDKKRLGKILSKRIHDVYNDVPNEKGNDLFPLFPKVTLEPMEEKDKVKVASGKKKVPSKKSVKQTNFPKIAQGTKEQPTNEEQ
jgi:ERCC4-type nuclease